MHIGESVEDRQDRVVVLHAYHDGFSWSDSLSTGIRARFAAGAPDVDLRFEYLDSRFNADDAYLAAVADTLAIKYRERAVDAVIACDDHALSFLHAQGAELFPDASVVFCSVSGLQEPMLSQRPMTGLRESIDIRGTIETALDLHPDCDELVVILDDSRTGAALRRKTEAALAELAGCPPRTYLSGLTADQLRQRLPHLSPRSIVLLYIFPPDSSGRVMSHEQNLARIRSACARPIYAVWEFYLGHGIVGGALASGEEEGRMVADLALRVLDGVAATDIPLGTSPVRAMFDHEELHRFGLDQQRLPRGSRIINQPFSFSMQYRSIIWVVIAALAVQMAVIAVLLGVMTGRRRTEQDLQASQRQLQSVLDAATQVAIIATDCQGIIRMFNTGAERMLGYRADEMVDLQTPLLIHDGEEVRARAAELSRIHGRPINGFEAFAIPASIDGFEEREWTFLCKDGERLQVHLAVTTIRNAADQVIGYLGAAVDITARKLFEEELRESRRMLRDVINTIPVRVFWKDRAGRYLGCNRLFAQDAGRSDADDIIGDSDEHMAWAEQAELYRADDVQVMESGQAKREYEEPQTTPDGRRIWLRTSKVPLRHTNGEIYGMLGTYDDITEQKRIDEQLRQSQKMDAIGQLAGGIAHDFNNMLGGIMGAADLLESYLPADGSGQSYFDMIMTSAERASNLTRQLLAFARRQPASSTAVDLHQVLRETAELLVNTIDRRIVVELDLTATRSQVIGDPALLHSALLNLGINASHAMPDGGRLRFCSREERLDRSACDAAAVELAPGPFLVVEVSDTGDGIDATVLPHVFEPFFTTKDQGHGTGLGLAAVYGTVQQHHGQITVSSTVGEGTTFVIHLPLSADQDQPAQQSGQDCHGSGRILVVDDEEVMRVTAQAILESFGYEIVTADNGATGLQRFQCDPDSFDLVVLDMIMPEMNGRDCFYAIRALRPEQRVLLASGFTRDEDIDALRGDGLAGFVRKPYRGQMLGQAVAAAIGA